MKLAIIGSRGQLGSDYIRYQNELGYEAIGLTSAEIDISSRDSVFAAFRGCKCDFIVNTAAYHGYEAYKDTAPQKYYEVNVFGPLYLAECAKDLNAGLVHFSTDYVFSGNLETDKGFDETDLPIPANLYAASKLAGENIIRAAYDRFLIFRVASLYGHSGCRAKNNSNFVEGVIQKLDRELPVEVVGDIRMSPTSTRSVVVKSIEILREGAYDLYHLAGSGSASWYEFALEIAEAFGKGQLVVKSNSDNIPQNIHRGKNTTLRNQKLVHHGFSDMPNWKESLREYLDSRGKQNE